LGRNKKRGLERKDNGGPMLEKTNKSKGHHGIKCFMGKRFGYFLEGWDRGRGEKYPLFTIKGGGEYLAHKRTEKEKGKLET